MEPRGKRSVQTFGVAPIGMYHVNLEGKITMANSEYAWMLGHESSDTVVSQVKDFAAQAFYDQKNSAIEKYVTLSLGIASTLPGHDTSAKDLVALADKALYEAKEGSRNQCIGKTLKNIQRSV